jgi:hypothetical protein
MEYPGECHSKINRMRTPENLKIFIRLLHQPANFCLSHHILLKSVIISNLAKAIYMPINIREKTNKTGSDCP